MTWRVYAASATGWSHQQNNVPCQDAFHWAYQDNRLIAAVCDGAGSAAHSNVGAAFVSREVVERLQQLSHAPTPDSVIAILAQVRDALSCLADEHQASLGDYACTLVAAWIDDRQCVLIHLGDGVAAAQVAEEQHLSLPENGEYANQTWFLTGDAWQEHVRFMSVPGDVAQLVMMSDGVQPFALNKQGNALFAPFISPVVNYLKQCDASLGSEALRATLDDPRTHAITGDDKTLLIALRGNHDG